MAHCQLLQLAKRIQLYSTSTPKFSLVEEHHYSLFGAVFLGMQNGLRIPAESNVRPGNPFGWPPLTALFLCLRARVSFNIR